MVVNVEGQRIVEVRPMTKEEAEAEGWDSGTMVLVLENGVKLYASCDDEGNSAGVLFGTDGDRYFTVS